jgi:YgiT-type zinc finger domain-containing protein
MKKNNTCKTCREGKLLKREVIQSFEREGLKVKIEGIPALVCEKCSQIYFQPGIANKIAAAADHLFILSEIKHTGEYRAVI